MQETIIAHVLEQSVAEKGTAMRLGDRVRKGAAFKRGPRLGRGLGGERGPRHPDGAEEKDRFAEIDCRLWAISPSNAGRPASRRYAPGQFATRVVTVA